MYDFQISLMWPEALLLVLAVAVMVADMVLREEQRGALLGIAAAGLAAIGVMMLVTGAPHGTAFHGAYVSDLFSHIVKFFVVGTLLTILLVTRPYLDQLRGRVGEHLLLILFAGVGMMAIASSNSLVVMFVALELATIPLMILTTLWRRDHPASEASVKFLIIGAVASAFMVFGIALIWGYSGGAMNLSDLRVVIQGGGVNAALILGLILLFVGLGFKTGLAPFHVWVPDVYQGAPTPITAFLAGGSKAAGFTALVRVGVAAFAPAEGAAVPFDWPIVLAVIAALTAIVGNMAAMWQTDLKRLLAHASVGHAGFLLMGLAVIGTGAATVGLTALGYYLAFYTIAVASVFFVMGVVERSGGSDELADYEGLGRRSPALAAGLLIAVLSMGGLPPLAGFFGKIFLLKAVVDAQFYWLAYAFGFAMVLSIVYTIMIMRAIFVARGREGLPAVALGKWEGGALLTLSLLLIVFGCLPGVVMEPIGDAMAALLDQGAAAVASLAP